MTEQPPNFDRKLVDWSKMMDALKGESQRGKVLVSAAFLDNQLGIIIESFLLEGRGIKKLLDGPTAPLATFSSRITMAYALGLIDTKEKGTIDAIRKIRNEFAHDISVSLYNEKMKKHFSGLVWAIGKKELGNYDASETFYLASQRIIMQLINRADHVAAARLQTRDWPHKRIDFDPDYDPY
jgi:mannitol operon repressor